MSDGFDYHAPLTTDGVRWVFVQWVDEYYGRLTEEEIAEKFDAWRMDIEDTAYWSGYADGQYNS